MIEITRETPVHVYGELNCIGMFHKDCILEDSLSACLTDPTGMNFYKVSAKGIGFIFMFADKIYVKTEEMKDVVQKYVMGVNKFGIEVDKEIERYF